MVVFEKYWIEKRSEELLKKQIIHYEARVKEQMCERLVKNLLPHVPFEKTISEAETTYEMQMYVFTPEKWNKFTQELQKYMPYMVYREVIDKLFAQPEPEQKTDNEQITAATIPSKDNCL